MTDPSTSDLGPRSTASDVLADRDLSGQRYLVTGGYTGLGLETCRALAAAGADVVVAGRDLGRAGDAAIELRALGSGRVEPLEVDLADPASIDAAVDGLGHTAVRGIIANAGVMACPLQRTAAGWEWQFAVNVLGHVRLVWRLVPALRNNEGATRLVMLSSSAHGISPLHDDDPHFHDRPYDKWRAYGQSKTADSLFAVAMHAAELVQGLDAFAVHPGAIATDLQRHLSNEEMAALGWVDDDGEVVGDHLRSPAQGAATQTWAATAPTLDGRGGTYLEDCSEAPPATPGHHGHGVRPHAIDPIAAESLWHLCTNELTLDPTHL